MTSNAVRTLEVRRVSRRSHRTRRADAVRAIRLQRAEHRELRPAHERMQCLVGEQHPVVRPVGEVKNQILALESEYGGARRTALLVISGRKTGVDTEERGRP
jgi:hypothetical protein